MRYLVVGGSGFFGSALCEELLKRGDVRVLDLKKPQLRGVQWIKGDIRSEADVKKAVDGIDNVFNLASAMPQSKPEDRDYWTTAVIGGSILRASTDAHITYISSASVYGKPSPVGYKETDKPNAWNHYGWAKYYGEMYADAVIRPPVIMGPRIYGIMKKMLGWISRGHPLFLIGNGENRLSMVATTDLARACILASNKKGVWNITSDSPKAKDLLTTVCEHAGKSRVVTIPASLAKPPMRLLTAMRINPLLPKHYEFMDKTALINDSKARKELSYKNDKTVAQAMIEAYDFAKF